MIDFVLLGEFLVFVFLSNMFFKYWLVCFVILFGGVEVLIIRLDFVFVLKLILLFFVFNFFVGEEMIVFLILFLFMMI